MEEILQEMRSILFMDVIEFAGTFAFAISGIRLAAAKEFDWFGAFVVGLVTAIGGGTLRDILLDQTPFWMQNPVYIYWTGLALLTVIIFKQQLVRLNTPFFIFDSIGLALFVVVGIEKTVALDFPLWVAVIMGTITGVVGGIIRDTLINEIPLIFRQEIYALACVIGGIVYSGCYMAGISPVATELITVGVILATRLLAVKFQWKVPNLKG